MASINVLQTTFLQLLALETKVGPEIVVGRKLLGQARLSLQGGGQGAGGGRARNSGARALASFPFPDRCQSVLF